MLIKEQPLIWYICSNLMKIRSYEMQKNLRLYWKWPHIIRVSHPHIISWLYTGLRYIFLPEYKYSKDGASITTCISLRRKYHFHTCIWWCHCGAIRTGSSSSGYINCDSVHLKRKHYQSGSYWSIGSIHKCVVIHRNTSRTVYWHWVMQQVTIEIGRNSPTDTCWNSEHVTSWVQITSVQEHQSNVTNSIWNYWKKQNKLHVSPKPTNTATKNGLTEGPGCS